VQRCGTIGGDLLYECAAVTWRHIAELWRYSPTNGLSGRTVGRRYSIIFRKINQLSLGLNRALPILTLSDSRCLSAAARGQPVANKNRQVEKMSRYLPGDVVSRRKGLVMHKGLVMRDGMILHNTPFRGEHVCSESEFRAGQTLHVTRAEVHERRRTLQRVNASERLGYNLFTNNCEHTVNRATTGHSHSPQLIMWAAGLGVGAIAFALTRHPAAAVAGYALGRTLAKKI